MCVRGDSIFGIVLCECVSVLASMHVCVCLFTAKGSGRSTAVSETTAETLRNTKRKRRLMLDYMISLISK